MCGIAGIIYLNGSKGDRPYIGLMTGAMPHRGPDSDGFFEQDGQVELGQLRLSIIDLSAAADQPFIDNSGRYVMVYNGEMYNYKEVRSMIGEYTFHTASDTEVLMAAYIKWGSDCIKYFRGMFAFAIWDCQEKELFIARDRMGVKPLYYYMDRDKILFASELRAILATGLVKRQLDQNALLEYFSFQSVNYPYSLVEGIVQLEAGSWMKIRNNGAVEKKLYWDLTKNKIDFDFTDKPAVQTHIRQLMLQSVQRRLVSDVPVGAFLSGGIDSSAVVGLMAEAGSEKPVTFNISFEEKEFDESYYADIVAKKFQTVHHRILLKPTTFLDELQNALNAMDTPSGDGINTYVVSKAIRRNGLKVALSGIGGDELFAGYPFFRQYLQLQKKKWLWNFPPSVRTLAARALFAGQGAAKKDRILQLLGAGSPGISDAYPVFRQILSPALLQHLTNLADPTTFAAHPATHTTQPATHLTDTSTHATHPATFTTSLQQSLIDRNNNLRDLPLLSQVSAAEYLGYTQHTLLKDTDQMSMAVSLEVREPFFDHDLVEFVLSIPDDLKMPVYPKSLLVESLKPLLPDEIVHRKKKGFLFPWELWLKNELRSFCDTHIKNMAQRPFIKGDKLVVYWNRFLAGDKAIRWPEIWLFVVLEYWMEKNGIS